MSESLESLTEWWMLLLGKPNRDYRELFLLCLLLVGWSPEKDGKGILKFKQHTVLLQFVGSETEKTSMTVWNWLKILDWGPNTTAYPWRLILSKTRNANKNSTKVIRNYMKEVLTLEVYLISCSLKTNKQKAKKKKKNRILSE